MQSFLVMTLIFLLIACTMAVSDRKEKQRVHFSRLDDRMRTADQHIMKAMEIAEARYQKKYGQAVTHTSVRT